MAIVVCIFFVDDEAVEAVGDVLKAVYLQMPGIFGGVRIGVERKPSNLTPKPFP